MSESIKRTALAANKKINESATPEELAKILTWSREIAAGLTKTDAAFGVVRDLQTRSAHELMRAYEVKTDLRSRLKNLLGTPKIPPERAELVLQTLPGSEVKPYVLEALLKSGTKKHLTLILSRATLPTAVYEQAAAAIWKLPMETKEVLHLVKPAVTSAEALKRIANLPYNHELYLEAVRNSQLTKGQDKEARKKVNVLVEKLLPDTHDAKEFEELVLASSEMTRAKVALQWGASVREPAELEYICNIAYMNDAPSRQAMRPLFERTFREFPADGILGGRPVEHAREITAGGSKQFREFCVRKLEGSDREKAIRLLRNSAPSVDEIEMMMATEIDPEERELLGREVVNRAEHDGFMLAYVAEQYPSDPFGKHACETLVRNWERMKHAEDAPNQNDIRRLQKLYPVLRDQLAMLLPLDHGDVMDRINEDLQ